MSRLSLPLLALLTLALVSPLPACSAQAAAKLPQALAYTGNPAPAPYHDGLRAEYVQLDFTLLADDSAPRFAVDLFGKELTVLRSATEQHPNGVTTFLGEIEDIPHSLFTVSFDGQSAFGLVHLGSSRNSWQFAYDGTGVYLTDVDPVAEGGCGGGLDAHEHHPDAPHLGLNQSEGEDDLLDEAMASGRSTRAGTRDDGSIVDVLFLYSTQAATTIGSAFATHSQNEITLTNTSFQNSSIAMRVRAVHAAAASYSESSSFETDLTRFSGNNDGYIDTVHSLRNTYGADLCALVRSNSASGVCGLAYLLSANSSQASYIGFSVSSLSLGGRCPTHTIPHELGHNFGCNHDRANAGGGGLYSYGYGYTNSTARFYTVMSYGCTSTFCNQISYFSNPNVRYNNNVTGTATEDNARVINNTSNAVSNFRQAQVTVPTPTRTPTPSGSTPTPTRTPTPGGSTPTQNPNCVTDRFEPNNTCAQAKAVTNGLHSGLSLCADGEDWYSYAATSSDNIRIIIEFQNANGDLDLEIYDASCANLLGESNSTQDYEGLQGSGYAGYRIKVTGYNGATNSSYTLSLEGSTVAVGSPTATPTSPSGTATPTPTRTNTPAPDCPGEDSFEPNDTCLDFAQLTNNSYSGLKACANDDDWYRINAQPHEEVTVTVTYTHSAGDIDIELYSNCTTKIVDSRGSTGTEVVRGIGSNFYVLRVYGWRGAENTYSISIARTVPTATPTPTGGIPTPTWTPTPTATPRQPTPTPTVPADIGAEISAIVNGNRIHVVELRVFNLTNRGYAVTVYVAVEVLGTFYFFPHFTPSALPYETRGLNAGSDTGFYPILELPLGAPLPVPVPVTWYAAVLDSIGGGLLGNLAASSATLE